MTMSEAFRWDQVVRTSCCLTQQDKEFLSRLNANPEQAYRYTGSTNKRKKTQKDMNLAALLNKIGPSPW